MAQTKVGIANLALSHLGNLQSIEELDPPASNTEKIIDSWYDITRRFTLKVVQPNFAIVRDILAVASSAPEFGYGYKYAYPADCLQFFGIGEVEEKENNFSIEGDFILTDEYSESGLNVRYLKDVVDPSKYTPEFVMSLAWKLAEVICMPITGDMQKLAYIRKEMPMSLLSSTSLSTQENQPIRISRSKFSAARYTNYPSFVNKR
jgi:hypothetical protein